MNGPSAFQKGRVAPGKIDGKTWLRYSISIWDDVIKTPEERQFRHPAMFPLALTDRLIKIFYSRKGGLVLDPFLGSGSTVCSAYRYGIPSVGFEISAEFLELAKQRLERVEGDDSCYPRLIQADCRNLEEYLEPESVGLCITSPPYWDVLRQRRSADGKPLRHYGDNERDLGSIKEYSSFLEELKTVFGNVWRCLMTGAYFIIIVMDIRKGAKFYPFHMDITCVMNSMGFVLDDIIIWDRRQEYNNLRPLGYPYVFRVNKIHEFILIFQKPDRKVNK